MLETKTFARTLGLVVSLAALACAAESSGSTDPQVASQQQPLAGEGPHRGPPPEAYAACEGKGEGDSCEVEFRDGKEPGTCARHPNDGDKLSCRPNRPPPGPPPGERSEGGPHSSLSDADLELLLDAVEAEIDAPPAAVAKQ